MMGFRIVIKMTSVLLRNDKKNKGKIKSLVEIAPRSVIVLEYNRMEFNSIQISPLNLRGGICLFYLLVTAF